MSSRGALPVYARCVICFLAFVHFSSPAPGSLLARCTGWGHKCHPGRVDRSVCYWLSPGQPKAASDPQGLLS